MTELTAPELVRSVGLLADGPVVWGRPVPARRGGIFLVELPETRHVAPIELSRVGKWLERVPDLRLDGNRPSSRALAARIASFWIPSAHVLYVGATDSSIGGRVEAIRATVLGDRRPHSRGHWLHLLTGLERARIWWVTTDAVEESEDAVLSAFGEAVPTDERAALPDTTVVLPFANLRTATGERKATGLTNSLLAGDVERPTVVRRVIDLPDAAAEGASGLPPSRAAGGTVRRTPRPAPAASSGGATSSTGRRPAGAAPSPAPRPDSTTWVSADGIARLRLEHDELTRVRRPEVIGRIRAAKELGDLKENADYTAAREEQSFLEGRIAAIEQTLRSATVIDESAAGGRVRIGSRVVVEDEDGAPATFSIVGSTEADPASGRISNVSPVGRALVGASVGETVTVVVPRGEVRYRVIAVE
jgi:transcription elongation factor GreA